MRTLFGKRVQHVMRYRVAPALAALVLLVIGDTAPVAAQGSKARGAPATDAAARLGAVGSWAYQLQSADPRQIARSPYDLVVVDYTRNGDPARPLKAAEIARMKRKPDGGRRIVLAYVSVGEAEDYRFYWDQRWIETATPDEPSAAQGAPDAKAPAEPTKPDRWVSAAAPPWLGDESETWSGNFAVKYWDPSWQQLMFGTPQSFVERVLALGFDGVYLDRVDAYYEHIDEHPRAADDMVDLVVRLAAAARAARPGALVVPQNGEELLTRPAYVAAIDAIAKEDLLYGSPTEGEPNSAAQVANSLGWLSHATVAGRPVLVVEYLDQPPLIAAAGAELARRGFIPYFGPRALDRLMPPPVQPTAPPGDAAAVGGRAVPSARGGNEPRR